MKRRLYLTAGFLSLGIGLLGVVLPLLDTTPFLLFSAFCFSRSSSRWHRWLMTHPIFGPYLKAFQERRGLTMKQKIRIGGLSSLMLTGTAWLGPAPISFRVAVTVWVIGFGFLCLSRTAPDLIKKTYVFMKTTDK